MKYKRIKFYISRKHVLLLRATDFIIHKIPFLSHHRSVLNKWTEGNISFPDKEIYQETIDTESSRKVHLRSFILVYFLKEKYFKKTVGLLEGVEKTGLTGRLHSNELVPTEIKLLLFVFVIYN
jgi:hypothetical protein